MKLWVQLTDDAQADILRAIEWLEQGGDATRFRRSLREVVELIREFPLAFPVVDASHPKYPKVQVRRVLLDKVPYRLLYFLDQETVVIVALHHTRSDNPL